VKSRQVIFTPEACHDLFGIYEWISSKASLQVAISYIERLETYCLGFDIASERGHRRDDVSLGLRIVGFERRVTIAFVADENQVTILRLFYGGQNWEDKLQ
jgi:toxin ParE1/3/4